MMINRRLFLGGTASLAALTALAACGSSKPGSDSPVALTASDINPQDRSALQKGGELRIPISSMIPNYNPLHLDGNVGDNGSILQYFTGVQNWIYAEDASFTVRTEFCLDYNAEEKDGKTVVTMHLNPKAKWNSGEPIQVADYQGVWKACNGDDPTFTEMVASTDGWNSIESIEQGADQFEMITTFKSTFPDWSNVLSGFIVPAALTKDAEAFKSWTDGSVTDHWTGPFIVTAADSTSQFLTLERNPNWWGEEALLDKVTLKAIDTNQLGTAFANKEIDVANSIIDASTYQQCQKRADAVIRQAYGTQWRHYTMNGSSGVLADQKLRQALVKGIDRLTVAQADLQGLPVPASQLLLGNHLFMPQQKGYQDNSGDLTFNKDQAIKELEELGWVLPEGKEFREKDGQTLSIKYLRLPDTATSATEGKILQANMKDIGVEVVMDDTNNDDFFPERVSPGKFEIVTYAWIGTPYPLANIGQLFGKDSASNRSHVWSEALEDLIAKIAVETDPDKRIELANQADQEIWQLAAIIPIYSRADYNAVPKNLANFGSFGLSTVGYENIGYMAQ
jgi:oligopeptide ABC superfamily ATP binding cassette transporter, binding protein